MGAPSLSHFLVHEPKTIAVIDKTLFARKMRLPHHHRELSGPTIGYGRALDVEGITEAEALYLLRNDIAEVQAAAEKSFPWFSKLSQVRQAVVISMIFNLGLAGFETFKATIQAIKSGNFEAASAAMLDSHWAREVGHRAPGLAEMLKTNRSPAVT